MKIAGFQKTSFVDYPKIVSCVVFTPGCNMRCSYCHNKHILSGNIPEVDELAVLDYLRKRVGVISGVVVSGGEPTLQNDLERFVTVVKNMGYKIKLDTNGTNPEVLKSLCEKGLVDYIAMDLKAPIEKYSEICCADIDVSKVKESIEYLQSNGIAHEFRTTFCPELTTEDILLISEKLAKNSDFYLQQYRQVDGGMLPHSREYVEQTADAVRQNGGKCTVRGL
ncbi:MAG: anaerobic ribonucleoside-triphosphate reductase activating protein [Clostridia bacterium]|nr:anaerobic ribonucleoside-triphosphate reductase activating protein [Clostridia bacterium]